LTAHCRPGTVIPALSAEAAHRLLTYPWPGNVRELDNLLQRALILANGPVIGPEHIQFEAANGVPGGEPRRDERRQATPGGEPWAAAGGRGDGSAGDDPDALWPSDGESVGSLAGSLIQAERDLILDALKCGQGSRREAAERLGISPRTLRYKLARLRQAGVEVPAA